MEDFRRNRLWHSFLLCAAFSACAAPEASERGSKGDELSDTELAQAEFGLISRTRCLASTLMTGHEEVPMRPTRALGLALVGADSEAQTVRYQLHVANIRNVIAAHIHLAPVGENGPVVAMLAGPFAPGGGRRLGQLSSGTLEASDLSGPLAGHSIDDLIEAIATGQAYVNVHTDDGVAPPNTGAGDFPGGEIRGQLMFVGPACEVDEE
jgi:hypothetical protein